jgi:hypothetical protein
MNTASGSASNILSNSVGVTGRVNSQMASIASGKLIASQIITVAAAKNLSRGREMISYRVWL